MAENFLARFLNFSNTSLNRLCGRNEITWFVSFGSLLWFIRDKNMGKKFNTDLDISVLGQIPCKEVEQVFEQYNFCLVKKLVDDKTGLPLQMVFEYTVSQDQKFSLDLYFWVKTKRYWWHAYDYYLEEKKIPSKYVFKATDRRLMECKVEKMIWEEIAPPLKFPSLYGSLLDAWYPDWLTPRKEMSKAAHVAKVKTCKNLKETLNGYL